MIWTIGIGGSLGAATRYLLGNLISKYSTKLQPFPIGTWIIKITGAFLLGFLTQLHLANQISELIWFFSGVGFCGAYTTFSTFGNETISLIMSNKIKLAFLYILSTTILGIISALLGLYF